MGAISDNIANVSTVGYKRSDVQFATMVTVKIGKTKYTPGGVQARPRQTVAVQGTVQASSKSTDLAVSGQGMFVVRDGKDFNTTRGNVAYTRAGSFRADEDGFLRNAAGFYLQGYTVNKNGTPARDGVVFGSLDQNFSDLEPVDVNRISNIAEETDNVRIRANLPAEARPKLNLRTEAGVTQLTTANVRTAIGANTNADFSSTVQVYDAEGTPRSTTLKWYRLGDSTQANGVVNNDATPNEWAVHIDARTGVSGLRNADLTNRVTVPANGNAVFTLAGARTSRGAGAAVPADGTVSVNFPGGFTGTLDEFARAVNALPAGSARVVPAPAGALTAGQKLQVTNNGDGSFAVRRVDTEYTVRQGARLGQDYIEPAGGPLTTATTATPQNVASLTVSINGLTAAQRAAGGLPVDTIMFSFAGGNVQAQQINTAGAAVGPAANILLPGPLPAVYGAGVLIGNYTTQAGDGITGQNIPNTAAGAARLQTLFNNLTAAQRQTGGLETATLLATANVDGTVNVQQQHTPSAAAPPLVNAGAARVVNANTANIVQSEYRLDVAGQVVDRTWADNPLVPPQGLTFNEMDVPVGLVGFATGFDETRAGQSLQAAGGQVTQTLFVKFNGDGSLRNMWTSLERMRADITNQTYSGEAAGTADVDDRAIANRETDASRPSRQISIAAYTAQPPAVPGTGWRIPEAGSGLEVVLDNTNFAQGPAANGTPTGGDFRLKRAGEALDTVVADGRRSPFGEQGAQPLFFEMNLGRGTTAGHSTPGGGIPNNAFNGTGLDGLTQFDSGETPPKKETLFINQDGIRAGTVSDVEISDTGLMTAIFDNGQSRPIYQIPVAKFANYDGLTNRTGNVYQENEESGEVLLAEPKSSGLGSVVGSALESSNVDLSSEFTDMIITQQSFTANTRSITTTDEMLTDINNMVR